MKGKTVVYKKNASISQITENKHLYNTTTHKLCCVQKGKKIFVHKSQRRCFLCEAERIINTYGGGD